MGALILLIGLIYLGITVSPWFFLILVLIA